MAQNSVEIQGMGKQATFVSGDLRLSGQRGGDITARRIELLGAIDRLGSISAAAKSLGISYRSAWNAVDEMNNLWESSLVSKQPGGAQGGGTHLTAEGRELIAGFSLMQEEYRRFTEAMSRNLEDLEQFQQRIRRFAMRTSARNQFQGRVETINSGPINTEVVLAINQQDRLHAIVSSESAQQLGLSQGGEAYALIKSSFILLTAQEEHCLTSARNRLCGRLRELRHGPVSSEAIIELAGGKTLTAIITEESAREMALTPGSRVCALIKASHVILGVN